MFWMNGNQKALLTEAVFIFAILSFPKTLHQNFGFCRAEFRKQSLNLTIQLN